MVIILLIPLVPMFLAIVNCWLIALEGGLVNPFQTLALVLWNACASHQEPACGKLCLGISTVGSQLIPESTFLQILLHTVAIPKGCTNIFLAQHMALEGCLPVPKESFMMILFDTVTKVVSISHVHLRLHVTLVSGFHVPLEDLYLILLNTFAVIVALADVEAAIDITQSSKSFFVALFKSLPSFQFTSG